MATWLVDLAIHFTVALAVAAALTPVVVRLAVAVGAVDQPSARKRHSQPTPLLGGVAMLLATWIAVLALVPWTRSAWPHWGFAVAALLVALVGLWDDLSGLSVSIRLVAQVAAAAIVAGTVGAAEITGVLWLDMAVTFLWIIGITNALNLLDNMDGAASAVTAMAAISFAVPLAAMGHLAMACVAAALAGSAIGFLVFNFPPARLFMGDAGSFFLGLTLAVLSLETQRQIDHSMGWVVAVAILVLPVFDTTLVTISRLRRGKNPLTTPGRDHLAHRLARLGWSNRQLVALFAAVTLVGGLSAWFAANSLTVAGLLAASGAVIAVVLLTWFERA